MQMLSIWGNLSANFEWQIKDYCTMTIQATYLYLGENRPALFGVTDYSTIHTTYLCVLYFLYLELQIILPSTPYICVFHIFPTYLCVLYFLCFSKPEFLFLFFLNKKIQLFVCQCDCVIGLTPIFEGNQLNK